jgi:hypothetical protein
VWPSESRGSVHSNDHIPIIILNAVISIALIIKVTIFTEMEESTAPTDSLLREGNRTLRTLKSLDPGLGVQLNTPSRFAKDLTAYRKSDQAYRGAFTLRTKTLSPALARLKREAGSLIGKAKNIIKPEFGPVWNERWTEVGFLENTIQTPANLEQRVSLLGRLGIFLKDHPQFEVEKLGITAAKAESIFDELTALRTTLENQAKIETGLSATRKATRVALQRRLRGLRHELEQVLDADDDRWGRFGITSPATRLENRRETRAQAKAKANTDAPTGEGEPARPTAPATPAVPASNGTAVLNG